MCPCTLHISKEGQIDINLKSWHKTSLLTLETLTNITTITPIARIPPISVIQIISLFIETKTLLSCLFFQFAYYQLSHWGFEVCLPSISHEI